MRACLYLFLCVFLRHTHTNPPIAHSLTHQGKLPFRVASSNVIFIIFSAIMLGNTTLGLCNALGVNNVVTVNSRQTILLASINFGGYGL